VSVASERLEALRSEGLACGKRMGRGRSCAHFKGHEELAATMHPDDVRRLGMLRHASSWEKYTPQIRDMSSRLVDTKTGDVVGDLINHKLIRAWGCERPSRAKTVRLYASIRKTHPPVITGPKVPLPPGYHGREDYWCPHRAADMWTCKSCNFGYQRPDGSWPRRASAPAPMPENVSWHYSGTEICMGTNPQGWNFERDLQVGNVSRVYSQAERRNAVELAARRGVAAVVRKTGIPRTTLKNWPARELQS
jgi:hypothetical protein